MQPIIKTGWLRQKSDEATGRMVRYRISRLDENQLPQVMALQQTICRNLQHPDLLHAFSQDFMKQHMGQCGTVLGVFVKKRLVAFRNLYYPDPNDSEWNLGIDLNLEQDQLSQVVNLQMVCVHPDFRGNHLALILNRIALHTLRERGTHPHVCATVSPHNIWNLPVLLASGFHVARLKIKYGGKVRYIVHQHLYHRRRFDDRSAVKVCLDDLDTQKRLLGAGFLGVQLKKRESIDTKGSTAGFNLLFKRPVIIGKKARVLEMCTRDLLQIDWRRSLNRKMNPIRWTGITA